MSIENKPNRTIMQSVVSGLAIFAAFTGAGVSARPVPFQRIGGHLDLWEHPQGRPDAGEAIALSIPGQGHGSRDYLGALQKPRASVRHADLQPVYDVESARARFQRQGK